MDLDLSGRGFPRYGRACAVVALVLTIAVGLATGVERASAQSGARVVLFVVDASTSMYGKPLMDARTALKGGSSALLGADVGLRSFGGRCQDPGIERLAIGPFDELSFGAAVDSVAIGEPGTPIPAALMAAGAALPPEGDRTLVLLSDGESSCGDPCPAAQSLKDRLGEGFRIDAVGFGTSDAAQSELACVARATGGTDVSVGNPAGLQAALAEASAARITSLRLSPRSFGAAAKGATVGKVKPRRMGANVLYTVSENVQARFTVSKARAGRRARGECRKQTAKNRRARRCTRYVQLRGSLLRAAVHGQNRFGFRGRWGGRTLRPGRYKLIAKAIDARGIVGKPKVARFRIVEARARR